MSGKLNYQLYNSNTTTEYNGPDYKVIPLSGTVSSFADLVKIIGTYALTAELTGFMTVPSVEDNKNFVFTVSHDDGCTIDLSTGPPVFSNLDKDINILNNPGFGTDTTVPVQLDTFNAYKIKIRLTNNGGPSGISMKTISADKKEISFDDFNYFYDSQIKTWPFTGVGIFLIVLLSLIGLMLVTGTGIFAKKQYDRRRYR
jgi:hypothetical protein